MSDQKVIIIKDTCVIIDMLELDIMDVYFELSYETLTSSFVIAELTDPQQSTILANHIENGKLKIDRDGVLETIQALFSDHPGLTLTDCAVLEMAGRIGGVVLSSDKALRNEANRQQFEVRGVLWVIKKLVESGILDHVQAIEKLKLYSTVNPRAPIGLIEKQIERLQKQDEMRSR